MENLVPQNSDAALAFARYATSVKYEDIPSEDVATIKTIILTTLGTAIGASTTVPVCRKMMELAREIGGKKESTIIAYGGKVPCHMAAFVNGALGHGLNFGDVSDEFSIHTGIAIIPAALSVAERVGKVNGKEFITACALGVDLMVRLAGSIANLSRDRMEYGWAPEQVFAYIPVAAVAGRLLGLNEDQMVRAFGLAHSQSAGVIEEIIGEGVDKALYIAYPGLAGVLSALMAQKGIIGPRYSLEGKCGLFKVYFQSEYNPTFLTHDLGKTFEIACLGFNPYPCCAHNHSYIKTALLMTEEHQIRPEEIESVTLFVGPPEKVTRSLCDPVPVKRNPPTLTDAQMSLPFTVAIALAKGTPRLKHFVNDGFKDPEILRISNRVTCECSSEYGQGVGTGLGRPAMEIRLRDGRVHRSDRKMWRYGHPKNPMSPGDHIEKFRDCASYSAKPMSTERIEKIVTMVTNLERVADAGRITRLIS